MGSCFTPLLSSSPTAAARVVHLESKVTQTGYFYLSILFALFVQDTGKALSPISTDAITIDVATSVIGYGLL